MTDASSPAPEPGPTSEPFDRNALGEIALAWDLGGPNYLPYRVMLLAKMLDRLTTRLLQESAGITVAEWRVIAQLYIEAPATVRQLAEQAWVDRAEVSRAAAALERRGLIERRDNPADRRSALFSCTADGLALVDRVRPLRREFHAALTGQLSKTQRTALDEALYLLAEECVARLKPERASLEAARVMNDLSNSFLLVYAGLFPIVNPLGSAPIFLGLTRHCTLQERHALAGRIAFNSFLLLLGSLFVGSHVLVFFGITLPVLRIAGGLVVTAFGWQMLHAGETQDGEQATAASGPVAASEAFYPLTMPLTVGPGSISVAITLGSQRPAAAASDLASLALLGGAAVAGLAAIAATIYVCYRFSEKVIAVLGTRGTEVMVRLSAFILLCIGIEILWNGCATLLHIPN